MENFTAKSSIVVNAPASKVWEALTNPEMVKQWLFGTDMEADWRVGGKIFYRGQWEGKQYEDKGEILDLEPEKKLVSTYFSGMSGKEDKPENYSKVTYELTPEGEGTQLTITQENNPSEESAKHSEGNWNQVLVKLKEIAEA
jgi:uncharacterized protein YndB with AHSA1/START domain